MVNQLVISFITLVTLSIFVIFYIKTFKSVTKKEYRKNANIAIVFSIITAFFASSIVLMTDINAGKQKKETEEKELISPLFITNIQLGKE